MELQHRVMPLELRMVGETGEADDGPWHFEGLAAAFHNIDDSLFGDIIAPGAFAQDLPDFLSDGFVGGLNHDWDAPLGRPLEARETGEGLAVKASISSTAYGRDVRTLMKDGVIRRLSIGFRALGRSWLETADEVQAYWRQHGYTPTPEDLAKAQHGARLLTRIRLYEISPVAVPANQRAVIGAVRGGPSPHGGPRATNGCGVPASPPQGGGDAARGMRFEEHCARVLAACEELLERAKGPAGLTVRVGRSPSPQCPLPAGQVEAVRRLRGYLRAAGVRLDELLGDDGRQPGVCPAGGDNGTRVARRLFAAYQRACARANGLVDG